MTSETMAKKRLTFSVDESLHNRLKAEAAAQGVPLGAYCSAILEGGALVPSTIEELDPATLAAISRPTTVSSATATTLPPSSTRL